MANGRAAVQPIALPLGTLPGSVRFGLKTTGINPAARYRVRIPVERMVPMRGDGTWLGSGL
jgi:hypothetical protein